MNDWIMIAFFNKRYKIRSQTKLYLNKYSDDNVFLISCKLSV